MMASLDCEDYPLDDPCEERLENEEFFEAVIRNDLDTASLLATCEGVNINMTNRAHKTPLYLALSNENVAMVTMLLDRKVDVNLSSYCSEYCMFETPVVTAARLERLDLVEMLLRGQCELEGVGFKEGKSALQWAASYGNIPMAKMLLDHGADVNWIGPYFHTALHYATMADKPDMVQFLLEHGGEISINGDARSPLHIAAVRGNLPIVKYLVKHDCEIDTRDNFSFTPFSLACLRGHLNTVQFLMENATIGTEFNLEDGLHRAAECGHILVLEFLLQKGAKVNAVNSIGETAISIASRGQLKSVELLLQHAAKINTVDSRGYHPLQHAVLREQVDIATLLIRHGSVLHSQSGSVDSPLQIAYHVSNPMLIKCFLDAGCQLDLESWFTPQMALEKLQELDYHYPRPRRFRTEVSRRKDLWQWIIRKLSRPQTLIEAARVAIRKQLVCASGGTSIISRLNNLPLPPTLCHYVALDDVLWM